MSLQDKNILITPNIGASEDPKIVFSGANSTVGAQNITLKAYPTSNGTLSFEGSAGQLFSVTNSLTGTLFSVNDVSGIPSIEVVDSGLIKLAQFAGNVVIGSGSDDGVTKLQLTGSAKASGTVTANAFVGPLTGSVTASTDGGIVNQHNGNATNWYGRILTKNSTSDKAAFLGTYGSIAGVFAHNGALAAWADLYINTVDGASGGAVRMPTTTYINGSQAIHAGNYNSYSPTLTGGGASGTWGISVTGSSASTTGNAATAATLQTARTINGVSFDGSANIEVGDLRGSNYISTGSEKPNNAVFGAGKLRYQMLSSTNLGAGTVNTWNDVLWISSYTGTDVKGSNALIMSKEQDWIGFARQAYDSAAWGTIRTILHSGNYNSYSPTLTGTGASGTWGIDVTGSAVNLSTNRTNWSTNGTISAVVGQLAWKNYNNNHTIFDASAGTSPDGGAVNNTNSAVPWSAAYPTLMGWNGSSTYGVRVDSARVADSVGSITSGQVTTALGFTPANATQLTGPVTQSSFDTIKAPGLYHYDAAPATLNGPGGSANYRTIEIGSSGRYSQIALPWDSENMWFRRQTDATWSAWRTVLHDGNYNLFSPTLTGTGASGTWGISVTGSAASVSGTTTAAIGSAALGSGTADSTTFLRGDRTWATVSAGATITNDTTTNATRYLVWEDATSGTATSIGVSSTKLYFNPSTGILSATGFTSLSDATKKTNVQTIEGAQETVQQLNGVTFDWVDGSGSSYGFIAQEIEKVLPHAVVTIAEGVKSVNYSAVVPFLVEAVKDQRAVIASQEARIARLEEMINKLTT